MLCCCSQIVDFQPNYKKKIGTPAWLYPQNMNHVAFLVPTTFGKSHKDREPLQNCSANLLKHTLDFKISETVDRFHRFLSSSWKTIRELFPNQRTCMFPFYFIKSRLLNITSQVHVRTKVQSSIFFNSLSKIYSVCILEKSESSSHTSVQPNKII